MLCFLDIEASGLEPSQHEILEIGAALYDETLLGTWAVKVKPEHIETATPQALAVNGYTPEKWVDAVPLADAIGQFQDFLKSVKRPLPAGHNVGFDIGFLKPAFSKCNIEWPFSYHTIDTVTLAYVVLKPLGQKSVSLVNICNTLGIPNEGAHTALADVLRTLRVYQALADPTRRDVAAWAKRAQELETTYPGRSDAPKVEAVP